MARLNRLPQPRRADGIVTACVAFSNCPLRSWGWEFANGLDTLALGSLDPDNGTGRHACGDRTPVRDRLGSSVASTCWVLVAASMGRLNSRAQAENESSRLGRWLLISGTVYTRFHLPPSGQYCL
jgi:hypothetical protein